ncbi:sal-like protein 1 [Limulus polyphemus]|uniref:Sal-like protein 1 n=1 Tax=Limulus polyphemus TaxID=6850 RepID=A0ABM1T0Z9_LIMPO|nr:sal-like protein 1 [Limulus polyphemus]
MTKRLMATLGELSSPKDGKHSPASVLNSVSATYDDHWSQRQDCRVNKIIGKVDSLMQSLPDTECKDFFHDRSSTKFEHIQEPTPSLLRNNLSRSMDSMQQVTSFNNSLLSVLQNLQMAEPRKSSPSARSPCEQLEVLQSALCNLQHQQFLQLQVIRELQVHITHRNMSSGTSSDAKVTPFHHSLNSISGSLLHQQTPPHNHKSDNSLHQTTPQNHKSDNSIHQTPTQDHKSDNSIHQTPPQSHQVDVSCESNNLSVSHQCTESLFLKEPNTLDLLQRHTEEAIQNTMFEGPFLLRGLSGVVLNKGIKGPEKGTETSVLEEEQGFKKSAQCQHQCNYCRKAFGSDSGLQIHLRSHTGERPFKCNVCGNRFSTKGNLKVHFQRHKDKYPHIEMNPNPVPEHLDKLFPLLEPQIPRTESSERYVLQEMGNIQRVSCFPLRMVDTPSQSAFTSTIDKTILKTSRAPTDEVTTNIRDNNFKFGLETDSSENSFLSSESPFDKQSVNPDPCLPNSSRESQYEDGFEDMDTEEGKPGNYLLSAESSLSPPTTTSGLSFFSSTVLKDSQISQPECHNSELTEFPIRTSNKSELMSANKSQPGDLSSYQNILVKPLEHLVQKSDASETSKLQTLVDNIETKINTDKCECRICHQLFSCKSSLQMHYRTHTGERPFLCKLCGRAFTTKENLKAHKRLHRVESVEGVYGSNYLCDLNNQITSLSEASSARLVDVYHPGLLFSNSKTSVVPPVSGSPNSSNQVSDNSEQSRSPISSIEPSLVENDDRLIEDLENPSLNDSDNIVGSSSKTNLNPEHYPPTSIQTDMPQKGCIQETLPVLKNHIKTTSYIQTEELYPGSTNISPAPSSYNTSNFGFHTSERPLPQSENSTLIQTDPLCRMAKTGSPEVPKEDTLGGNSVEPQEPLFKSTQHAGMLLVSPDSSGFRSLPSTIQYDHAILDITPKSCIASSSSEPTFSVSTAAFSGLPFPPTPGFNKTTCGVCFKTFACSSALAIHIRSHTKERPFRCNLCDRGFTTKGNMKQHMLTHDVGDISTQNNPASSPSSSTSSYTVKSFLPTSSSRNTQPATDDVKNKRTHENVTPQSLPKRPTGLSKHECLICNRPFSSGSALNIHMRTHTGDRPFKCNVCDRAFTTKGNLKVHMGTHMWANNSSRRGLNMEFMDSPTFRVAHPPLPGEFQLLRPNLFFPPLSPLYMKGLIKPSMNQISVIHSSVNMQTNCPPVGHQSASKPQTSSETLDGTQGQEVCSSQKSESDCPSEKSQTNCSPAGPQVIRPLQESNSSCSEKSQTGRPPSPEMSRAKCHSENLQTGPSATESEGQIHCHLEVKSSSDLHSSEIKQQKELCGEELKNYNFSLVPILKSTRSETDKIN